LLRNRFNNYDLNVYLIMGDRSVHNNPEILLLYDQCGVRSPWFQFHGIYCFQPLNLHVFSSFKSHQANLQTRPTEPQLEGKPLPILYAWDNASYVGVAYSAWRLGAIEVKSQATGIIPEL
jgi:hypothetical protein